MGTAQLGQESETGPLRVRAFFGLPVPDPRRHALGSYLEDCATAAPQFRWTPAANLHLTVRFLGQVESGVAQGIADRLSEAQLPSFDLKLGELGMFKRGRL